MTAGKDFDLLRSPCGVVSAWRIGADRDENLFRHFELLDLLIRNGFLAVAAEAPRGPCWKVFGAPLEELLAVAKDFGQDTVLYGPPDGLVLFRVT